MTDDQVVSFAEFRARIKGAAFVRDGERRCAHLHTVYDPAGGTVECEDCGKPLSAFVMVLNFIKHWGEIEKWKAACREHAEEQKRRAAVTWQTLRKWRPHLQAAKVIEKHWRGRRAPCCPHCGNGLLPEDFTEHGGFRSRDYELGLRQTKTASSTPSQ